MLICALADNDRIFDAEIIKEQMKLNQKEIPNAKTFNTLLDAYCRNNNYSKRFKKLVNEMIEKKIFRYRWDCFGHGHPNHLRWKGR